MTKKDVHRHEQGGRAPGDPEGRKSEFQSDGGEPSEKGSSGNTPPENRPGHHPDQEQDKPEEVGGAGHTSTEKKDR